MKQLSNQGGGRPTEGKSRSNPIVNNKKVVVH